MIWTGPGDHDRKLTAVEDAISSLTAMGGDKFGFDISSVVAVSRQDRRGVQRAFLSAPLWWCSPSYKFLPQMQIQLHPFRR